MPPPQTSTITTTSLHTRSAYRKTTPLTLTLRRPTPVSKPPRTRPIPTHLHRNIFTYIECKHWLEIQDKHHRYGTYLRPYYEAWLASRTSQTFFTWLDTGNGSRLDLSTHTPYTRLVSRAQLESSRVQYCSEKERQQYRVNVREGRLCWANASIQSSTRAAREVDTCGKQGTWIFVIDACGNCFVNKKVKGRFHHSSFVAGAPVRAAGRLVVEKGCVVSIAPNSGHYRTSLQQLQRAVDGFFAQCLNAVTPDSSDFPLSNFHTSRVI